jgi:hypothetical protein
MDSGSAQVVRLDDYREPPTRANAEVEPVLRATLREHTDFSRPRDNAASHFADFYPLRAQTDLQLARAITLLSNALSKFDEAVVALRSADLIAADDLLQQIRALLPDIFVISRKIGDGFAAVILATFHSLVNADSSLNEDQMIVLRNGLRKINSAPYADFQIALTIGEEYEDVGLEPDSHGLSVLGEAILASD